MSMLEIKSVQDITEDRLSDLLTLAENLSTQNDDVIQLYGNNSIMDPKAQRALESPASSKLLGSEHGGNGEADAGDATFLEDEDLGLLSFPEEDAFLEGLWSRVRVLFTGLRKKVRRIFCKVVA